MDTPSTNIIVLENVSYTYPGAAKPLLDRISLSIPRGQWVSIVGRNGSGKSTLTRLLNGLLEATSGKIVIAGIPLSPQTADQVREKIGMIFPNPDNQFVGLTVRDDIVFGLENLCLPREEIAARLEHYAKALGVDQWLDRHPAQLSGGQKQRVAIASVLAMEPEIVIFDESTSMLDEASKHDLIATMRNMRESGRYTILTVTHDYDEWMASDRVIALDDGSIIADCSPQEFVRNRDLLARCRMVQPFLSRLAEELNRRGIKADGTRSAKEFMESLWESFPSITLPTTTTGMKDANRTD